MYIPSSKKICGGLSRNGRQATGAQSFAHQRYVRIVPMTELVREHRFKLAVIPCERRAVILIVAVLVGLSTRPLQHGRIERCAQTPAPAISIVRPLVQIHEDSSGFRTATAETLDLIAYPSGLCSTLNSGEFATLLAAQLERFVPAQVW